MASNATNENNSGRFFDTAANIGNAIRNSVNAARNKWKESSTGTKAIIIGSATAVAAPLAILPVLSVVGFTSAGVAAGSLAASVQTATTVSGSFFALCQSAAATGVVATTTSVGVGLGAGTVAGGVTAAVCRKKSRDQNKDEETQVDIEEEEGVQEDDNEQRNSVQDQNVEQQALL